MDFNLPAWMTPEGESANHFKWLDETRQRENSNVQNHVALGHLALQQQQEELNQKIGAASLVSTGLANQESELRLKDHMDGLSEWNDYLNRTGGDPAKMREMSPPTSAYALQRWSAVNAGYAQSVSGAAKVRLTSDFHTKLAQLDDEGFTSVNDMMQADGGMNPDGTPTNMVLQELSNQGARMVDEKQKRAESLAAIRPTITGQNWIDREQTRGENALNLQELKGNTLMQLQTLRSQNNLDLQKVKNEKDFGSYSQRAELQMQKFVDESQRESLHSSILAIQKDPKLKLDEKKSQIKALQNDVMMSGLSRYHDMIQKQGQPASQSTSEALPMPKTKAEAVTGKVYQTKNGPMKWDGEKFVPNE